MYVLFVCAHVSMVAHVRVFKFACVCVGGGGGGNIGMFDVKIVYAHKMPPPPHLPPPLPCLT